MSVCFSVLLIMVCFLCECGSHVARRSQRTSVLVAIALPLLLTPLFCSYQMRTTGLFVFSFCFVFSRFLCLCMGGLHLRIGWVIVPTNIAECCLPYLLLFLYHISNLTRLSLCMLCKYCFLCLFLIFLLLKLLILNKSQFFTIKFLTLIMMLQTNQIFQINIF